MARFTSATWLSTLQLPAYDLGRREDLGRRVGMMMTLASVGALTGPPISGAIIKASGGYTATGYYAGASQRNLYEST